MVVIEVLHSADAIVFHCQIPILRAKFATPQSFDLYFCHICGKIALMIQFTRNEKSKEWFSYFAKVVNIMVGRKILFLLTPSITVPLFKVVFIIRCVWHAINGCGGGVGSGMLTFLALDTCLMLRKNMWWGVGVGDDVNVPWIFLHVWCYARLWAGLWRMMLTFLELAYMFDATQDVGIEKNAWFYFLPPAFQ